MEEKEGNVSKPINILAYGVYLVSGCIIAGLLATSPIWICGIFFAGLSLGALFLYSKLGDRFAETFVAKERLTKEIKIYREGNDKIAELIALSEEAKSSDGRSVFMFEDSNDFQDFITENPGIFEEDQIESIMMEFKTLGKEKDEEKNYLLEPEDAVIEAGVTTSKKEEK